MLPGRNRRGHISFEIYGDSPPPSPSIIQNVAAGICGRMVLNESLTLLCISVQASKPRWCAFAAVPSTLLFTHTQTQKPPVFEGTQWGLTSHFTRAGGISGADSSLSQTADNNSIWSKWRSYMTLEFKFMLCLQHVHTETMREDSVTEGIERNGGGGVKSKQWKAHWWEETYIVNDVAGVSVLWLAALVRLNVPQRSARNHLEHNFIVVQNLRT